MDTTDTEGLLVLGVELGREDLNDVVGVLLLGLNVGIEIGFTGLDGCHDGFEGVTTLFHIALDLPVELDIRGDIKVKGEVDEFTDTVINEGVESLNDDDGGGLDLLGCVKGSVNVVVNGLHDALSVLKGLDMLIHEVELLLGSVKGGEARDLTSVTVVKMVIIKTDDSGKIGHKSIGFPSSVIESSSEGSNNVSSESRGHTTHEGGLSATGIGGKTNDNGNLSVLKCHLKGTSGVHATKTGGHEGRGKGGNGGGREGSDTDGKLHCWIELLERRFKRIVRHSVETEAP